MKKPILLLIYFIAFFGISIASNAQDNEMLDNGNYHELGINATSFINEFISLNNNSADLGDYMITYKYHFGAKALRFGLGGQFSQLNEDVGGGDRDSKSNILEFRIGYEWNKQITKRWAFYTGMDIVGGNTKSVSETNNFERVTLTNSTTSFGGGPILGIQFFINSHISLATEGSLYYRYSEISDKEEFSISSEFNKDETSSRNAINFGLPTALFFVIRF